MRISEPDQRRDALLLKMLKTPPVSRAQTRKTVKRRKRKSVSQKSSAA
jgi:hypothetical protein